MGKILSEKSKGFIVKDRSSGFISNDKSSGKIEPKIEGYVYLENKTIRVGEPMGLLLALTYPNTFSFTAERI
jgi:hypothetical protein